MSEAYVKSPTHRAQRSQLHGNSSCSQNHDEHRGAQGDFSRGVIGLGLAVTQRKLGWTVKSRRYRPLRHETCDSSQPRQENSVYDRSRRAEDSCGGQSETARRSAASPGKDIGVMINTWTAEVIMPPPLAPRPA